MRRVVLLLVTACSSAAPPPPRPVPVATVIDAGAPDAAPSRVMPPVATQIAHEVKAPYGVRVDPYNWLGIVGDAATEYAAAESAYTAAVFPAGGNLEKTLEREARARYADEETKAPQFEGGFWHYAKLVSGKPYPLWVRRARKSDAEQVIVDTNELAGPLPYFQFGGADITRNGMYVAWLDDVAGDKAFTLRVKNLETNELHEIATDLSTPSVAWASDNKTLFYADSSRVLRHTMGSTTHDVVYEEQDFMFDVDVTTTQSRAYVVIRSTGTTAWEARLVDAYKPTRAPRVFIARRDGHRYDVGHAGKRFVMRTNDEAPGFRLVEIAQSANPEDKRTWKSLLPYRADVSIDDFSTHETFVVAAVHAAGLARIQLVDKAHPAANPHYIGANDPTYSMTLDDVQDPKATSFRYEYYSLNTPGMTYELDVKTGARTLVHAEPVPTYDASLYTSAFIYATTRDGVKVPISIAYKRTTKLDGTAPLLIAGYGSAGESSDLSFDRTRVSLLDRGWVYAVAHVRGGDDLGRAWQEAGSATKKQNTFDDFVTCTQYLVEQKYGAKDRVFAEGERTGGLLMAVIANQRPDLYRGLLAWEPFVDVISSMMSVKDSYYLDNWGNPHDKAGYASMLTWSPYDNITAHPYPALYVRPREHDSDYDVDDAMKWVAKLRATKTDDNLLVLDVDRSPSNGGGNYVRFESVREKARAYAFLLSVLDGATAP